MRIVRIHLIVCAALILIALASPAWGGCGKWVVRDNTDYLKDEIFDDAVESSTGSSATVGPNGEERESNATSEENGTQLQTKSAGTAEQKGPEIVLDGKWSLSMNRDEAAATSESMELILIQSADRLSGYGTLLLDGSQIPATATGAISGDGISLDVKLLQLKKEYRLNMALTGGELIGGYELYESELLTGTGNATASRSGS